MQTDANRLVSALMKIERLEDEIEAMASVAKPSSYVWLLEQGENHEGGSVLGIFNHKADALLAIQEQFDRITGYWKESFPDYMPEWDSEDTKESFSSGCDYWHLHKRQVI